MKHTICHILLTLTTIVYAYGQSIDKTYVLHRTYSDSTAINFSTELSYYDGLGRPFLLLTNASNASGNYTVRLLKYDKSGRLNKEWLPAPVLSLSSECADKITSLSSAFYSDEYPYTQTAFDALGRTVETWHPGGDWRHAKKKVSYGYGTNKENQVLLFFAPLENNKLIPAGYYKEGTLSKEILTDEDDGRVEIFKDYFGRKVMESRGKDVSTYYVYNDRGQLRFVLPQGYFCDSTDNAYNHFAYEYRYDKRNLCVWKKMPGAEPVQFWYDGAQRLTYSQDGNQRKASECFYYLYDYRERLTEKGVCSGSLAGTGNIDNKKPLVAYYYDNYSFLDSLPSEENAKLAFITKEGFTQSFYSARGLMTGKKIAYLDGSGFDSISYYYDAWGNVIQSSSTNCLKGFDISYFKYTYSGNIEKMLTEHMGTNGISITEEIRCSYDSHSNKLTDTYHRVNNNPWVHLSHYSYDAIGNLIEKTIGASEVVNYTYNLRRWPTSIKSTHFCEVLAYQSANGLVRPAAPLYGGNISAMLWQSGDEMKQRYYDFTYDSQQRLISATSSEIEENTLLEGSYNTLYKYDVMGNILSVRRNGLQNNSICGQVDNISFCYIGNQLAQCRHYEQERTDKDTLSVGNLIETKYAYDDNGNMICDHNKGITSISYNVLNLPADIVTKDGSLHYIYDAEGTLLSKQCYNHSEMLFKVEFCDNVIYKEDSIMILVDEGFVSLSQTNSPKYHFYLKDHLGNNRVVLSHQGNVEQVNHYYPFGSLMDESVNGSIQPYKYNGKFLESTYGINWYEFGTRMYDGLRFTTPDRFQEKYYEISPYAYSKNNPLNVIDIDGDSIRYVDSEGLTPIINTINRMRNNSSLFAKLYSKLELSSDIYYIGTGVTTDIYNKQVGGFFRPSTNEIVFSKTESNIPSYVIAEEFFHAYQFSNAAEYDMESLNLEYEAKLFNTVLVLQNNCGFGLIEPIMPFQERIIQYAYGDETYPIKKDSSTFNDFLRDFQYYGKEFVSWYKKNETRCNPDYYVSTSIEPYNLLKIILK